MSLFSGIADIIAGAALIAGAVLVEVGTLGGGTPIAELLFTAGAGMIISGVGTLMAGDPLKGFATTTRNPIAPWRVCYGRVRTGGTLVYLNMWGGSSKMLDMVIVLAAHPCEGVDELLFDQQRIQLDTAAVPAGAIGGSSFTPVQQTVNIASIVRADDVVTVVVNTDIPYLTAGDKVIIQNVPGDPTLNNTVDVAEIISRVPSGGTNILTFTYINGGAPASVTSAGQVKTLWADYGRTVYMETLLGGQTLGHTFKGMAVAGTPWLGSGPLVSPQAPGPAGSGGPGPQNLLGGTFNPWTDYCSLVGKTAVFLRLTYDEKYFSQGLPQISFHVRGKKDIYDPRLGAPGDPGTTGYTENSALCIADFLHNQTWGFKAAYGTEIPTSELASAADICDQSVTLARGGSEPRYTCNGQFELTSRRGEILQNLLTSCGGRLTYTGGQFVIQPASWTGTGAPSVNFTNIAAGPVRWRPTVSIRDVFNGVKGTYISPSNKWQSTDFPAYAQDAAHGYAGDANLAADGGDRRWLDIQLPFTISDSMAQRLAKIELLRRRHWGTGTLALNMAGYQFAPLDIVKATLPFLGWSDKQLEISAVRFRSDKQDEVTLLGTEIDVQETDSSIYQWATSEELSPQGFVQNTRPVWGGFVETAPLPWSPGYVAPLDGDAVYPEGATGPGNFGIQPSTGMDAAGNPAATLQIKGTSPINALDTDIASPQISCVGSATGGSLPPGTYVIGLSAYDSGSADHGNTEYLNLSTVEVGGSGSGSIGVTITWGSGDDGGDLYLSLFNPDGHVFHFNQTLAPGSASATITSFDQSTAGGPDLLFDHFAVAWQEVIHAGVWAQQVQAVTPTTVTIAGAGMASNQWAGYVLSLLAKADLTVEVPLLNMPVASSTASSSGSFVLTIGPNSASVQLPDLTTLLEVGDLVVMRTKATFTDTAFADPNIANPYYPSGATGVEAGHVAVVLSGADAGDIQTIASVGVDGSGHSTIFNLSGSWKTTPATGDIVIVCAPQDAPEAASAAIRAKNSSISGVMLQPYTPNLANRTWLFRVRTEDANGVSGPDSLAPVREYYIFGSQSQSAFALDGYFTVTPDGSGNVTIDLANGLNQRLVLSATAVTILAPIFTGGAIVPGSWFALYVDQDATGGRAAPTYTGGAGGFATDLGLTQSISGVASTRAVQQFTYHGSTWGLDSFRMEVPI